MYIDPGKLSKKGLRKYQELYLKEGPFEYEALNPYEYFTDSRFIWEYRKSPEKHRHEFFH